MALDPARVRQYLQNFELGRLFIEELGWDRHVASLEVEVDGHRFALASVAEKRGAQVFECQPGGDGRIPEYNTRRKIEKQATKFAYEHLIIFVDAEQSTQIWQWVAREPGQPAAYREHPFYPKHQTGDALIQKLHAITIPLDEEESLDLTGTVHKLRDAFDRERVTRQFYEHFKREHGAFLSFIKGIRQQGDKEWYASLMLNRLMFVYFIQKKRFLDDNPDYLQDRLRSVQARKGKGKFLSFYRYFLLCLFHEGFSKRPAHRTVADELRDLLGAVPYLNGGLFELHELEERNPKIDIPDEAFERLFAFFDQYEWHLDTRFLRNDREINPDVLGYIFEKYINQKEMGAYYTKEDITEYMAKNTIIPFLFEAAEKRCAVAFHRDSEVWRLLREEPNRYIYADVRRGVVDESGDVIPLPKSIAVGVDDPTRREVWGEPADAPYALPTESWRDYLARRDQCLKLRKRLARGELGRINDLLTHGVDVRQFAQDVIDHCEGPELLRAFYESIAGRTPAAHSDESVPGLSVLDPTCGSGAFLFAALNVLEPLYEACLERMEAFVREADAAKPRSAEEEVGELIAEGESRTLEFKSSARWDVHRKQASKKMETPIVTAVAAMLNTDGGDLLIGVDDDGGAFGVEHDFRVMGKKRGNRDGYENWLTTLLLSNAGRHCSPYIKISFAKWQGKEICRVSVRPSPTAVYIKAGEVEQLFVRTGNSSRPLSSRETVAYHKQRFESNSLVADREVAYRPQPGATSRRERHQDFRRILSEVVKHPNTSYFILKSIIVNNLYGVDIVEEAVELCKLRLFLKMVAQVEAAKDLEPLPDIDFNIRPGNTLVGFTTLSEVERALADTLGFGKGDVERIVEEAGKVEGAFEAFHEIQTEHGVDDREVALQKEELKRRIGSLTSALDRYLAAEYGIDRADVKAFTKWRDDHQPFHWFADFFGIMSRGGFDVVVGNPPYVEVPKELNRQMLRTQFQTALDRWSRDEDVYTFVVERSLQLLRAERGKFGMILPLSLAFSTKRPYGMARDVLSAECGEWWFSHFDRIPGALFGSEVRTRCTIAVLGRGAEQRGTTLWTTSLLRWATESREHLFSRLSYSSIDVDITLGIPKVGSQLQADTLKALLEMDRPLAADLSRSLSFNALARVAPDFPQPCVFVGGTAYNWFPAWRDIPETITLDGEPSLPARTAGYRFDDEEGADVVFAFLCSSLGYWWWAVASDGFNLKKWLLQRFPLSLTVLDAPGRREIAKLGAKLREELVEHYVYKDNRGRIGNFFLPACQQEIAAIDAALARHIGCLSDDFFVDIREFNSTFSRAEAGENNAA